MRINMERMRSLLRGRQQVSVPQLPKAAGRFCVKGVRRQIIFAEEDIAAENIR